MLGLALPKPPNMPAYTPDQERNRRELRRYAAERGAQTVPDMVYKRALDDGLITYQDLVEWGMSQERLAIVTGTIQPSAEQLEIENQPRSEPINQDPLPVAEEPEPEPFPNITLQQLFQQVQSGERTADQVIEQLNITEADWKNISRQFNENPFPAWKATPVLSAKRTDLWVFGIPGSGKSVMLSAVLGRLAERDILLPPSFETINKDGYRYRNYLEGCYKLNMFPVPTQAIGFNYIPLDLDYQGKYRPANLIEMAGEKVRQVFDNKGGDTDEYDDSLNALEWLKSPNRNVITLVLDITSDDWRQNNELAIVVGLLKKVKFLEKTTKIILLATKVDTLASFAEEFTEELEREIDKKIEENFSSLLKLIRKQTRKTWFGRSKIAAVMIPFSVGSDIVKEKYLKGSRYNNYIDLYIDQLIESIDIRNAP